jgi:hypothetical protein
MSNARLVYAGGVEAEGGVDGWRLVTAERKFPTVEALQAEISLGNHMLCQPGGELPIWLLSSSRSGRYLLVDQSELLLGQRLGDKLWHIRNLSYHLGAVIYHCTRLALAYVELCKATFDFSRIPGFTASGRINRQGAEKAYYEFDACVTAARRIYDVLRFPIWTYFNSSPIGCPKRLHLATERADRLPTELRKYVEQSWSEWGQKARDYRNSIQHFVPVEFGMSTASMTKLECGAWSVRLFIPDNPHAQSRQNFSFTEKVDALEYSRNLASAVCELVTTVVNAIAFVGATHVT